MERERFKRIVIQALDDLPDEFIGQFDNIDIIIEDKPTEETLLQLGTNHHQLVLGLYQGVPLTKRSSHYGMVLPDKITIFQKNVESICLNRDEDIKKLVQKTIIHEVAHFFGLSEAKLRELGY